jgi:ABC-type arginine transport system permease subunit
MRQLGLILLGFAVGLVLWGMWQGADFITALNNAVLSAFLFFMIAAVLYLVIRVLSALLKGKPP